MKKVIFAGIIGLAMWAAPSPIQAAPPGFYGGGYRATTFPAWPAAQSFNYYASPYGYRTFNTSGFAVTPFGVGAYNYGGTYVRPYVNAPYHSVYWNPFLNTYQYSTGYMNSPYFYSGFGWGW